MDLNEYIGIKDGIIVIIVLIFCNLLDLLLSEDSFKERGVWDRDVGEIANTFFHNKKCCIV